METKTDLLEVHEAIGFLLAKESSDFCLFKEGIEIGEILQRYSYDQTLRALHLSRKYSDHLFFLIKQKIPSFLLLSDQTYIKISNDFCSTPEEFYNIVVLHFNKKYKYPALNKEVEGKICVSKAGLSFCSFNLQIYSEENIKQILESSLEEKEINPFLLYFCYLATHKKSRDFQSVSTKTQYEVVDFIDPNRKYQEFGLKMEPHREINEPFIVIRLFIRNYKCAKGRPSNVIDIHTEAG